MSLRSFSTALKNSLINNDEFNYAHLVKFEKPTINEDKGRTSRKGNTYTYITDGAFDIIYDDGSVSAKNVANGPQTYIANKIRNVGSVTETVEAKASNMSLTLDTSSLGTSATSLGVNFAAESITVNSNIDLIKEGFKEGDKVKFTVLNGSGSNNAKTAIIKNFTSTNVFTYTIVDSITANNDSAVTYKINLISEELTGVISDKLATTYQTYLNREVFIYKAHFDPITNAMIGEPYLLFKGIISGGSISEDPEKESKITWTLTSHWGDFSRVSGRLTVDEQHRALNSSGIPDQQALVRPEYAGDLGFIHANQTLSVMALYNAIETSYKQVDINGGWFGGKRLREVESTVQRRVDLDFNLTPKYLPVVYGVRKTDSIPIFVDTDTTDPTKVYVAYAICEGQVAGLLDFYVNGTGSVCVDEADEDLRSITNTDRTEADLLCRGRMDKGDALQGIAIQNLTTETDDDANLQEDITDLGTAGQSSDSNETGVVDSNVPIPRFISDTGVGDPGILHEQYHKLTSPLSAIYIFHAGKGDQDADPLLVSKAAQNEFKIQNSYYTGTKEYWGPSHRLLDTAYVVAEYTIDDGETSIPELDFIVRGRGIKCFNYDSSYARDTFRTAATLARQFNLGDIVTLKKESDDSTIATGVEIIDKWSFLDIEGDEEFRFRLSYATAITENFYMTLTKGGQAFEYNFSISTSEADVTNDITVSQLSAASSGFTVAQHTETVGGSAVNSGLSITLSNTVATAALEAALTNTKVRTLAFSGRDDLLRRTIRGWEYDDTTNKLTKIGSGTISTLDSEVTGLVLKETIVLENEESTSNDEYNGYGITLTRFDANGVPHIQRRRIVDYIGAHKIAIVDVPWESDYLPTTGDRYVLTKGREDIRVSLNPAMQLLDYLTNERYGRGLDLDNDINLETFKEAARQCDTQSDVTVVFPASTGVAVNDIYRRSSATPTTASNFNSFFKGTVSSVVPRTVGGVNYDEVTFTNVIGKLGTKFATWLDVKSTEVNNTEDLVGLGTLLWNDGKVYEMTTDVVAGSTYSNNTKFPTHDSGTTQNGLTHKTTVPLTKVAADGTDDGTVNINISLLSTNGNPLVKSFVGTDFSGSGYSLYDADDVKYWKYIGWDSNHQRNVTRHQMNQVIATSNPVFDNINLMLNQFNGILRYSNGKYELGIRTKSSGDGTFVDPEIINESDIIGSISLKDGGVKKSYNSVNTSIVDPQVKFETRSVSFFNSDYLKEDRNIPKQGQYGLPGITNYYNARYNINQRLDESRFGLTISFKMMPKGGLLLPGNLIRVNYPRFGYENKEFRITNVTTNSDCLVNITADEHNDSAFTVRNLTKPRYGRETAVGSLQNKATVSPPAIAAGTATTSSITVNWTNSTGFNFATDKTQVWVKTSGSGAINNSDLSPTPNTSVVSLLATVENGATTFVESINPDISVTRSYWLRHVREIRRDWSNSSVPVKIFSAFHATGASGGYSDTSDALFRPRKVDGLIFYARTSGESTSVTSAPTLPGTKFYNFGLKGIVAAANSTSLLNAPSASVDATGFGQWMNELLFDNNLEPGLSLQPIDTTNAQVWASRYTGEETTNVGTGSISITLSTPFLLSNTVAKVNTSDVSTFGGTLIDDANATAARTTLGLGTAATAATGDFVAVSGDTMTGTLDMGNQVISNVGADITFSTSVDGTINFPSTGRINFDSDNNSAGEDFIIASNRTAGTGGNEHFRITAAGNVGIEATSPGQKLDVAGNTTSNTYMLRVNGSVPTADAAIFRPINNTLALSTGSNERVRITSTGKVGIGTTAPTEKLHVAGRIVTTGITTQTSGIKLESLDTSVNSGESIGDIEFSSSDASTGGSGIQAKISAVADNSFGTSYALSFQTGSSANPTEKLKIANNGAIQFNQAYTFPTADGSANQVLQTDGSGALTFATVSSGGSSTFVGLSDTPANFTGADGKYVKVNSSANALEFDTLTFSDLGSKPTTIAGYGITDALELGASSTTALAGDTSIPSALTDLSISDGTNGQFLKTDGSGGFSFATVSTSDSTKLPLAGGTLTGDVTFTGDSYNIVFDKSDSALEFADGAKATFGDSNDLKIYHTSTVSVIEDSGTGNLQISTNGTHIALRGGNNNNNMLKAISNGAVELYNAGSIKLATNSAGVLVTGTVNVNSAYTLPTADGTSGQVLQTDGSGALTFATVSGGGSSVWSTSGSNISYTSGNVLIGTTIAQRSLKVGFSSSLTSATSTASGFATSSSTVGKGLMINNSSTTDNTYANLDFLCGINGIHGRMLYRGTDHGDEFGQFEFITTDDGSAVTAMKIMSSGNVIVTGSCTATSFPTSSDYRLKTNIEDISYSTPRLLALKPKTFKWKDSETVQDGFLAHEVAEIVPEAVVGEKDGTEMQTLDQTKLIPLLVKTIQELEARIAVLEG